MTPRLRNVRRPFLAEERALRGAKFIERGPDRIDLLLLQEAGPLGAGIRGELERGDRATVPLRPGPVKEL